MKKRNVRHLTTALATASFLASSPSFALGIGEMHLQSALNQTLQAEISLILSEGEKSSDFQIGFASNAKFDAAGIPWTLFLSKIKFKTVTQNDKTVIKLSSTEVLKEPFLDFLLEIKSSKGTLYREFTVLVDPPNAYQSAKLLPSKLPQRLVSAPTPFSSKEERTYGPTHENETPWSIAAQFNKQNNVSIAQMSEAIYIANPDAFYAGRSSALIPGKMLKIPSLLVATVQHAPVVKHTSAKKLPKMAATTNPLANNAANRPVTVVKKEISVEKLPRNQPPVKIDSAVVEPAAFQQKVAELEKQVSAMQKTIAEKDAQMNALKTPNPIGKSTAVVQPVIVPAITPKNPPAPVIQPVDLPPMRPTSSEIALPTIVPAIMPEETTAQAVAVLPPPVASTITRPTEISPTVTSTPAASISLTPENYFGIPTDMYYYIAGGTGSLLLGLLGWLRWRVQSKAQATSETVPDIDENEATETINNDDQKISDNLEEEPVFDDELDLNFAEFENLSLSAEFNNESDEQTADAVLSKADVYCAYGNNELAQKLLYDEFFKRPEAHDYALRLLKLYATEDFKSEFKNFVFELAKLGKNDLPEFWTQVSDLAAEFYPEALFFMPPPAVPDPLTSIPFEEIFASTSPNEKSEESIDFDSMSFDDHDDKEITFGELTQEETLSAETPDFLKSSMSFDDSKFTVELGNLDTEALAFEIPAKKEPDVALDFSVFAMGETSDTEALTFEIPAKKEPEIALDFSTFAMGETSDTE
ncbi:MAG: hypothetical protein PHN45_12235, partial [Methylococcales bacterium]|nr:hypothetical protein [Methylococcales bacterium]